MGDKTEAPFVYRTPHPLLAFFPEAAEDDLAAMTESILSVGVQQKLTIWIDPKGREYLIDGRTRQAGAEAAFKRRLMAEPPAAPVADNGLPLQPEVEVFNGTLADVYNFIKTTHVRKHYTPGQKAALGVNLYYYEYKQRHSGRLPDAQTEVEQEGAQSASELALRFGCNEYYVRICRQLYREAPELLDAVAAGHIPPAKAMAALKEKRAGSAPELPGEEGEEGAAEGDGDDRADAGEQLKDAGGFDVPDSLKPAFAARTVYKAVGKKLTEVRRAGEVLAQAPGGHFIDGAAFDSAINAALNVLRRAFPTRVCTACGGAGKPKGARAKCSRCDGAGFVCKLVEAAEKKALKDAGKDAAAPSA